MSDSQEKSWFGNPNAPKISRSQYQEEKIDLAGEFISSILYGIVTILFFKCMAVLSNPVLRKGERIKWGLVSYTVVMFLVVTVQTAMGLDLNSIAYIDNRGFPGIGGELSPGPYGYKKFTAAGGLNVTFMVMFVLNDWLADGLMLYRCYVIYSKNLCVLAFPCIMYLSSVALGITFVCWVANLTHNAWFGISYFSISLSLSILLTLMIVTRLILHTRSIRTAMGISGIGGSSKAIVAMLVESYAIYAANSLLFIVLWSTTNIAGDFLFRVLSKTQVIAPLLVITRVANKGAFTSNTPVPGRLGSSRSWGQLTGGSDTLPGGNPSSSVNRRGVDSYELEIRVETTTNSHRDT